MMNKFLMVCNRIGICNIIGENEITFFLVFTKLRKFQWYFSILFHVGSIFFFLIPIESSLRSYVFHTFHISWSWIKFHVIQ